MNLLPEHILDRLYAVLQERMNADPQSSYVAGLFARGTEKIAQKVIEEASETIIEAIKGDPERLREESADLLFHLMVLWTDQDILPQDVFEILERRFGTGGLDEKKSRSK
jgi:phosphoribosyl-ATP pyrophosphohydrolase